MGSGFASVAGDVESAGRIIPPALVESGCRIGARSHVGGLVVLGRACRSASTRDRARGRARGREIGADCTLSDCIVAAGATIGDDCHVDGRRVLGEGVTARRRQLVSAARGSSRACRCRTGRSGSDGRLRAERRGGRGRSTDRPAGRHPRVPAHLRDALWRVDSAGIAPVDTPGGVIVAGMGGSAIGGGLAQAALGDHASRPVPRRRRLRPAAWTTPEHLVLCASYSGDTEETLACYEAA